MKKILFIPESKSILESVRAFVCKCKSKKFKKHIMLTADGIYEMYIFR